MSQQPTTVVLAESSAEGSRVFGRLFDRFQLETYDALEHVLAGAPAALALTGPEMPTVLDRIIPQPPSGLEELHLHLREDDLEEVSDRLAQAPAWTLVDLDRATDGTPVLVLRATGPLASTVPASALALSLTSLRAHEVSEPRWPEALRLKPAPRLERAPGEAKADAAAPGLSRTRKLALATLAALVAGIALLVLLAVLGGFEAVVIGLLAAIALLALAATAGVAYALRLLRRLRQEHGGAALDAARARAGVEAIAKRQGRVLGKVNRIERAVPGLTAQQVELQEYLAEFAGQVAEATAEQARS